MLTQVSLESREEMKVQWQISSLSETAEEIKNDALGIARMKSSPKVQESSLTELLKRRDFVGHFKHALAQGLAPVIAFHDQRVQAIYLFEESANPDVETEDYPPMVDITIHLLVLVSSASAALESFAATLDRALTEKLSALPSALFTRRTTFLNVIPVTQDDVETGRGYAAILRSVFAPPLKVWQRD